MIGIIGAMQTEVELLIGKIENAKNENISGIDFVSGKLAGVDVVVAKCGIGKVFAALCAQTMILKYSPRLVINTGVGGSLSDKLNIHLEEIDRQANTMMEQLTKQYALEAGATETLKAQDQMHWVQLMENCRNRAEQEVMESLIYS